jgi:hypothetical protein
MATTYSTSLKLSLIGDGDQSGIWGQTTNNNLGTLLEQAITGVTSVVMADATYTLTNFNGVPDESRNAVLVVSGTNNGVRDVVPPLVEKLYTVVNNTTGGYAIRVIGTTGTGVNIPSGATCLVYCDGTNFYSGLSGTPGNFTVSGTVFAVNVSATTNVTAVNVNASGNVVATGNVTATLFAGSGANLTTLNATNLSSGTVPIGRIGSSGTPSAATYFRGDNSWSSPPAPSSLQTANFSVFQDGIKLVFQYDGANVASLSSTGIFRTLTSVISGTTP